MEHLRVYERTVRHSGTIGFFRFPARRENEPLRSSGPDWLLVTHGDWRWPGPEASSGLPALVWITGDGGTVVTGAILDGGMRLASLDMGPTPEEPTEWFVREIGRFPDLLAWLEDDDGDGVDKLGEYGGSTGMQLTGTGFALSMTPRQRGLLEAEALPAARTNLNAADQFHHFPSGTFRIFYLLDYPTMEDQWRESVAGSGNQNDILHFAPDEAIFLLRRSPAPLHRIPAPWTP